MNQALITYLQADKRRQKRALVQQQYAIRQSAEEGRDVKDAALVNAR